MTTQSKLQKTDVTKSKEDDVISKAELDVLKADANAKAKAEADLVDVQKANDELASELADLKKAKEEADKVLADLEKAKIEAKFNSTVDVIKGFSLVDEDKIEDVAKFLVANETDTATAIILTTLEKAHSAIREFGATEHGTDLEGVQVDSDEALSNAVSDIIKSRKAK